MYIPIILAGLKNSYTFKNGDVNLVEIFFRNVFFIKKSRCNVLIITQKANFLEHFEVWKKNWNIDFFGNFQNFKKIWNSSTKIKNFHEKIQSLKAITAINSNDIKIAPKARDHDLQGCRPAPARIWKYKTMYHFLRQLLLRFCPFEH